MEFNGKIKFLIISRQMDKFEIDLKVKVWIFDAPAPWYMVTIPIKDSAVIRERYRTEHRGWGSIPATVQIGESIWKTSIFWEKAGTYLLPIKKEIRNKEKITSGDIVSVMISIENLI